MAKVAVSKIQDSTGLETLPPKRAKPVVFQIRITQETVDRIAEIAELKEIPVSTLARMWLLERLAQERQQMSPVSRQGEWV